jgi:hypothetical protein
MRARPAPVTHQAPDGTGQRIVRPGARPPRPAQARSVIQSIDDLAKRRRLPCRQPAGEVAVDRRRQRYLGRGKRFAYSGEHADLGPVARPLAREVAAFLHPAQQVREPGSIQPARCDEGILPKDAASLVEVSRGGELRLRQRTMGDDVSEDVPTGGRASSLPT